MHKSIIGTLELDRIFLLSRVCLKRRAICFRGLRVTNKSCQINCLLSVRANHENIFISLTQYLNKMRQNAQFLFTFWQFLAKCSIKCNSKVSFWFDFFPSFVFFECIHIDLNFVVYFFTFYNFRISNTMFSVWFQLFDEFVFNRFENLFSRCQLLSPFTIQFHCPFVFFLLLVVCTLPILLLQ